MAKKALLTEAQKREVLKDFCEWSGGYSPSELYWSKREAGEGNPAVLTYIRHHEWNELPKGSVYRYLKELHEATE